MAHALQIQHLAFKDPTPKDEVHPTPAAVMENPA
jgi:hypothetical protein